MFSFILFFNLLVHILQSSEITVGPISRNTTLYMNVEFTCEAIGYLITFYVDGKLASTPNIMNRGFQLLSESTENGIVTRSLIATAYEENNNTNITCGMIYPPSNVTSPPAVLLIQGILDGVGDLMATVLDGSNVSLTWTPPYSLDNVPITGYNIITSDGINTTVNTPYHILTSSDPDPCNITTASVGAINDVGTSQYNNESFYYSSVPDQTDITSTPRVQVNLLTLSVLINLSDLCIGERPTNITIDVIYSDDIINSTDISMISRDQLTIDQMITILNITDWMNFIINITLYNEAGERLYSIPLVHLSPVNNITSFLINCSTISVSWERPSVSDGVNIHNYTLLIYRDDMLVNRTTVKGSTTSYQFKDNELFSHEYTYVIYGSNELGEGDYSNGTFSYLRVPTSIRNITTLTLLNDTILYFNIPIMFECPNVLPVNVTVSIYCDDTILYDDGFVIYMINQTIDLSDNITLMSPSHYELCQLSVRLTNGRSISYVKEFPLMNLTTPPMMTPTTDYPPYDIGGTSIIGIVLGVTGGFVVGGVLLVLFMCICVLYKKRKQPKGKTPTENVKLKRMPKKI